MATLNENCPGGVKAPLLHDKKYSEEFKGISGNKDISIYWNNQIKKYHLMMKRKFIMYLDRPISDRDRKRVKDHFNKLRSNWYRNNVRKNIRQTEIDREARSDETRRDFERDSKEMLRDTLQKQKRSVSF